MLRNDKDDVDVVMSLYHIKGNMFFPHCHAHHWQMEGCPSIFHAKPLATERQMESLSKMKGALGQYWPWDRIYLWVIGAFKSWQCQQ